MLVLQAYVAECITSIYTCTNLWNSETCVQRNSKGPNFFRCRRVPFYTGTLSMNHRDSKSSICKIVLLQASLGYTQVPLNTGFTVLRSVTTSVNTQRRNGKSRSWPHFCNSVGDGAETFGAESIWSDCSNAIPNKAGENARSHDPKLSRCAATARRNFRFKKTKENITCESFCSTKLKKT